MMNHDFAALREAVAHLKAALPEADLIQMGEAYLKKVARYVLGICAESPFRPIPEDVFRLYVLFPRVNNERLTFYHEEIGRQLKPRLVGLSMGDAALEVNRWCFEQATYRSTSPRTASPLAVMRAGFGRCGEESTLAVSAMRAAGIPARQCYVPRWAHCDDNHAWIEVWVDGEWHYMGACEPEPVLNSGWFTAAASRAMLVQTRAYGMPPLNERVETISGREFIVNRTAAYAPAALVTVRVCRDGVPCPDTRVLFELCNMAEFFPICQKLTDRDGGADLLTGLGDLRVRVLEGGKSFYKILDVRAERECVLDLSEDAELKSEPHFFRMVPPAETRIQPTPAQRAMLDAHRQLIGEAERLRAARLAGFITGDPYADRAGGNAAEIVAFLSDERFSQRDKTLLLDSLSEKDFFDIDREVLSDALLSALPWKDKYEETVWQQYILCPRVLHEELRGTRRALREALGSLHTPEGIWEYLLKRIELRELSPAAVFPDSRKALACGFTNAMGLDILFVDACRALGIPARLNRATGEKEFLENGVFVPLLTLMGEEKAKLSLLADAPLAYFEHFTLSRLEEGRDRTLKFEDMILNEPQVLCLHPGSYSLTAVTRQIDGSIDGVTVPVALRPGENVTLKVEPPADSTYEKLLYTPLPILAARTLDGREAQVPEHGARTIIAFLEPGEEPTEHFLCELTALREELTRESIAIRLIVDEPAKASHPHIQSALSGFHHAQALLFADDDVILRWHRILRCGDLRKPFAAAVDGEGRGLFAFSNYFVGSVRALLRILDSEQHKEQHRREEQK